MRAHLCLVSRLFWKVLGGGSSLSLSLSLRFPLFFHTQVRTLFSDTGGVLTFSFRNLGSLFFFSLKRAFTQLVFH